MYGKPTTWKKIVAVGAVPAAILLTVIIRAYANRISIGYTDSAGFMELISRNRIAKPLESEYFTSALRIYSLYGESPEKICDLIPEPYAGTRSVFSGHPYLISVLGSAISWFTNLTPNVVAACLLFASFLLGFVSILIFLAKNKVPHYSIALFGLTICFYPVLTHSMLGQPYFDRLIFGPAISIFLLIWSTKTTTVMPWKSICVLTIALATISERGAALAGLISVGYLTALHGKQVFARRELRLILLVGLSSILYLYIWSKLWQNSVTYGQLGFHGWFSRLDLIFSDNYFYATRIFFVASASFLFLGLFAGRGYLVLAVAIAPNLLIGVGGAELNGFSTHYHQVYLPVLLAVSTIGLVKISELSKKYATKSVSKLIEITFISMFAFFTIEYNFNTVPSHFNVSTINDVQALWLPFTVDYDSAASQIISNQRNISDFVAGISEGLVSAPENMHSHLLLSGVDKVDYWPFGVGSARVVVAPHTSGLPDVLPYADPQGSTVALQQCVQIELTENYEMIRVFENDLRIYLLK